MEKNEITKERQLLLEMCSAMLKEPTRFNIRRLVVLAQCIKDLDQCAFVEAEDTRLNEKRSNS